MYALFVCILVRFNDVPTSEPLWFSTESLEVRGHWLLGHTSLADWLMAAIIVLPQGDNSVVKLTARERSD